MVSFFHTALAHLVQKLERLGKKTIEIKEIRKILTFFDLWCPDLFYPRNDRSTFGMVFDKLNPRPVGVCRATRPVPP